jgi:hypothetical protein
MFSDRTQPHYFLYCAIQNHSAAEVKNPQGEAVLLGGFYHVINQLQVDFESISNFYLS